MSALTGITWLDAKISVNAQTGCWIWVGGITRKGYGRVCPPGRRGSIHAHRCVYELVVGVVPKQLDMDHLCRVRACVNPSHLEPVTRRENILRGESFAAIKSANTHCPQGHPYEGTNLRVRPDNVRICRACNRNKAREYYHKANPAARTYNIQSEFQS